MNYTTETLLKEIALDSRSFNYPTKLAIYIQPYYNQIIQNNLSNVYKNNLELYRNITSTNYNYKMYCKFVCLLSFIIIVVKHQNDKDFTTRFKDEQIDVIINWCLERSMYNLSYLLNGPKVNSSSLINYIKIYNWLVSLSLIEDIPNSLQLLTVKDINSNLKECCKLVEKQQTGYNRYLNKANGYLININSGDIELETDNNILYFNCSNVSIGTNTDRFYNINDKINDNNIIVPKSTELQLSQLMNEYTTISIKHFMLPKLLFRNDLTKLETCYVEFPFITLSCNSNYSQLRIDGKFKNYNYTHYIFEPDNSIGMIYKTNSVNVKSSKFRLSSQSKLHSSTQTNSIEDNIFSYNILRHLELSSCYNILITPENSVDNSNLVIINMFRYTNHTIEPMNIRYIYNRDNRMIQLISNDITPVYQFDSINLMDKYNFSVESYQKHKNLTLVSNITSIIPDTETNTLTNIPYINWIDGFSYGLTYFKLNHGCNNMFCNINLGEVEYYLNVLSNDLIKFNYTNEVIKSSNSIEVRPLMNIRLMLELN